MFADAACTIPIVLLADVNQHVFAKPVVECTGDASKDLLAAAAFVNFSALFAKTPLDVDTSTAAILKCLHAHSIFKRIEGEVCSSFLEGDIACATVWLVEVVLCSHYITYEPVDLWIEFF